MRLLPVDLDYAAIPGLSRELAGKLAIWRPADLGEAQRVEGMTPPRSLCFSSTRTEWT